MLPNFCIWCGHKMDDHNFQDSKYNMGKKEDDYIICHPCVIESWSFCSGPLETYEVNNENG